jgi:hypothetical protein
MRVSNQDITDAFEDLLSGARTREEIAKWALSVRSADDAEGIEYHPSTAESAIWNALEFLTGIDLKEGLGVYLHTERDFEEYWLSKKELFV